MSALTKRVAKLEGAAGEEEIVVLIDTFGAGGGEYTEIRDLYGKGVVTRQERESEADFLRRGQQELVRMAKEEGRRGLFTFKASRPEPVSGDSAVNIRLSLRKGRE